MRYSRLVPCKCRYTALHVSHPLPTSPLLLYTLLSKRWECFDVSAVDCRLDEAAEPGLVFLGAAHD